MTTKPQYIFRVDEIHETDNAEINPDHRAPWVPSVDTRSHALAGGGASGCWWFCDGIKIHSIQGPPPNSIHYQTTTMYFNGGFGFWVSRGDAMQAAPNWQPLNFDYSTTEGDRSSYVTNAGQHSLLACTREDQKWPHMLLPDVYHGPRSQYPQHGGLKGDISILWALIAFSMGLDQLPHKIPQMFRNGEWKTHTSRPVRTHKRGVVVWVYTCQDTPGGHPNANLLLSYEQGYYGNYYN